MQKKLQNRDYGKLGDGDLNYGAGLGLYSPYFSVSLYITTTYHVKGIYTYRHTDWKIGHCSKTLLKIRENLYFLFSPIFLVWNWSSVLYYVLCSIILTSLYSKTWVACCSLICFVHIFFIMLVFCILYSFWCFTYICLLYDCSDSHSALKFK